MINGDFLFLSILFNAAASAALKLSLCRSMLGLKPGLLQHLHLHLL
jgi:hypothetical protein